MAQISTRKLRVIHTMRYTYDHPIQRSFHKLRLCPINDWDQRVLAHSLTITPHAPTVEFEDVFGNWLTQVEITEPYTELTLSADSIVELSDSDPFAFAKQKIKPAFPLDWKPWEQAMLEPYLRPTELPDTEITELFAYAMSFVEKTGRDLMETLFAINLTLDPTNGILPQLGHVRTAYGRFFRDATSTTGTLYTAAQETLTVDVAVTEVK
jgi:transglutaminase-like putative cysteine protease